MLILCKNDRIWDFTAFYFKSKMIIILIADHFNLNVYIRIHTLIWALLCQIVAVYSRDLSKAFPITSKRIIRFFARLCPINHLDVSSQGKYFLPVMWSKPSAGWLNIHHTLTYNWMSQLCLDLLDLHCYLRKCVAVFTIDWKIWSLNVPTWGQSKN